MSSYDEYMEFDEYEALQRRREQRKGKEQSHNPPSKSSKNGFLRSRAFLAAVTVTVYATAIVMLFAFSKDLGINIRAFEEATTAQNVLENPVYPEDFTSVTQQEYAVHDGHLLLIGNDYPCEHDGINLVNMSESSNGTYLLSNLIMEANETTLNQMNLMFADFHKIVGDNDVMISCCYRSRSLQQELYDEEIAEKGEEEGSRWVTQPGCSEHQSGYAFDLSLRDENGIITEFDGEGKYGWIAENCAHYGFIIRYPEDKTELTGIYHEPWHLRYVGIAHAYYMQQHNLCLEEYIELLKEYSVENPLEYQDVEMNRWNIYYVPAENGTTEVPVPDGCEYEISGNNVDGFIVTVSVN